MTEILKAPDNYILHTAVTKINVLEQRTSALEENQKPNPEQSNMAEIDGHLMLVRELLSIQKENSRLLKSIAEDITVSKTQIISSAEQLKSLRSKNEIVSSGTSGQLEELKKLILNSPREVLQEKRILLFSEYNAREYLTTIKHIVVAFLCFFLLKYLISCLFHLV